MKSKHSFLITLLIVLNIMTGCKSDKSELDEMVEFGQKYTDAWNSKVPEKMASFYAEDGTLTVNNGTPAVGRKQLAETAKSYMDAFPDLELTMDSLTKGNETYRYYWTFKGTNSGPNGTGNKVDFSGFEEWTMNDQGLVQKSIGTYDAEEYKKQLNGN
ncbi:ester cyclase [Maribacter sp. 4G9]|jgi:nuclear transport factor 2 (NTF2) superfamily protein|uniref:ester cyclase n=1 Tax=Maribacter sp. 4G9 TaxID=1889777 RepID=UPI001F0AC4AB|nr:ester cyclase [Maribacter sp. 4G9]